MLAGDPQQRPTASAVAAELESEWRGGSTSIHYGPEYYREMGQALKPIIMEEMVPAFLASALAPDSRGSLKGIVTGEKPAKMPLDIRSELDTLIDYYDMAGGSGYGWKPFGPEMRDASWSYFSFDPPEKPEKAPTIVFIGDLKDGNYGKSRPAAADDLKAKGYEVIVHEHNGTLQPLFQESGELFDLNSTEDSGTSACDRATQHGRISTATPR